MLPQKLKNINLFNEGASYLGVIAAITLPKIAMLTEDFRGGGMIGTLQIDQGIDKLEAEWTLGGWNSQVVTQLGALAIDGVLLRAIGAFQAEDGSGVRTVEAVMMGRHSEVDFGEMKPGESGEKKIKSTLSYYKLIVDGQELVEIDIPNGKYVVGGVDRYAEIRNALGA